jgi:hypothetical protein
MAAADAASSVEMAPNPASFMLDEPSRLELT